MGKNKKQNIGTQRAGAPPSARPGVNRPLVWAGGVLLAIGALCLGGFVWKQLTKPGETRAGTPPTPPALTAPAGTRETAKPPAASTNALPIMEVNKAVMVTVELDFGPKVPTIAEAIREVERRHQPDDGQGRTFAVLDAYGEPTPNGKLHMSMHVSAEKPGVGSLVFRRTGEVLWQSRIVAETNTTRFSGKNLLILLDDGAGKTFTVDGSNNPTTILDANIKEMGVPVSMFWPDGAEREATFIYSACGCPVKVKVKRTGFTTVRTKDLPVMFPDDPAVVTVISRLMGW